MRKERHADKDMVEFEVEQNMYQLLMGSNQIIHNRGRALAYISGMKKRGHEQMNAPVSEAVEVRANTERKKPHEYSKATSLKT